jgi:hypothetical protein
VVAAVVAVAAATALVASGPHHAPYKKGAPPVDQVTQGAAPRAAPTEDPDGDGALEAALRAWAQFPVDADPRPIVFLREVFGQSGFHTGAQKVAFMSGNWTMPQDLPSSPAMVDGYPIITAREALERLRTADGNGGPRHEGRPITVSSIRLGRALAPEDRGGRSVPAWEVRFTGSLGPNWVPAVAPPARYDLPPGTNLYGPGAVATHGGRRLSINFFGSPDQSGPCGADYAVKFRESAHAVAFRIVQLDRPTSTPSDQPVTCDAVGYNRNLSITLDQPIGNRVLVEADSPADIRGPLPVEIRD